MENIVRIVADTVGQNNTCSENLEGKQNQDDDVQAVLGLRKGHLRIWRLGVLIV